MIDWTKSMTQTFEYYVVDPDTWQDKYQITNVMSSTITRDSTSDTLGSFSMDLVDRIDECYIRVYLIAIQNDIRYKFPLGTFLVQTPSSTYDGTKKEVSMDGYTPLIELKEKPPEYGHSILKGSNIMSHAYMFCRDNVRAPIVAVVSDKQLYSNFVSTPEDTCFTYLRDLITKADFHFDLDELGRIMFAPNQEFESIMPIWTYSDDNSSILGTDISMSHDIFEIPNVVEVIYSSSINYHHVTVKNEDPNSITSTIKRGREIVHRIVGPEFAAEPSENQLKLYAERILKEKSSVEYKVSYTHGYCPVRVGDCIRLDYKRAGLSGVKAKVISQTIQCSTGCRVSEKAVFKAKLWR